MRIHRKLRRRRQIARNTARKWRTLWGLALRGGVDAANLATRSLIPVKACWTSTLNSDTSPIREKLHRVLSFTQLTIDTKPTSLRQRPDTRYRLHPPRHVPRGRLDTRCCHDLLEGGAINATSASSPPGRDDSVLDRRCSHYSPAINTPSPPPDSHAAPPPYPRLLGHATPASVGGDTRLSLRGLAPPPQPITTVDQ